MAKDPAFLFYPGDASEDTQFMNRLERGCYFDLLKAQKKFGRFSLDQIKKVLGNDFEICWEALKISLSYENDMYFIGWLEESIEKRKEYSQGRRNNRLGNKKTEKDVISITHDIDINNICSSCDEHMENENINENEKGNYIIIKGEKIFDLKEWFNKNFSLKKPHWQKIFPLANIDDVLDSFFSKKAFESFNDGVHFRNSFAKELEFINEKMKKEKGKVKNDQPGKAQKLMEQDQILKQINNSQ